MAKRARLQRPRANLKRRKGEEIVCVIQPLSLLLFPSSLFKLPCSWILSNNKFQHLFLSLSLFPSVSCPRESAPRFLFIKLDKLVVLVAKFCFASEVIGERKPCYDRHFRFVFENGELFLNYFSLFAETFWLSSGYSKWKLLSVSKMHRSSVPWKEATI